MTDCEKTAGYTKEDDMRKDADNADGYTFSKLQQNGFDVEKVLKRHDI